MFQRCFASGENAQSGSRTPSPQGVRLDGGRHDTPLGLFNSDTSSQLTTLTDYLPTSSQWLTIGIVFSTIQYFSLVFFTSSTVSDIPSCDDIPYNNTDNTLCVNNEALASFLTFIHHTLPIFFATSQTIIWSSTRGETARNQPKQSGYQLLKQGLRCFDSLQGHNDYYIQLVLTPNEQALLKKITASTLFITNDETLLDNSMTQIACINTQRDPQLAYYLLLSFLLLDASNMLYTGYAAGSEFIDFTKATSMLFGNNPHHEHWKYASQVAGYFNLTIPTLFGMYVYSTFRLIHYQTLLFLCASRQGRPPCMRLLKASIMAAPSFLVTGWNALQAQKDNSGWMVNTIYPQSWPIVCAFSYTLTKLISTIAKQKNGDSLCAILKSLWINPIEYTDTAQSTFSINYKKLVGLIYNTTNVIYYTLLLYNTVWHQLIRPHLHDHTTMAAPLGVMSCIILAMLASGPSSLTSVKPFIKADRIQNEGTTTDDLSSSSSSEGLQPDSSSSHDDYEATYYIMLKRLPPTASSHGTASQCSLFPCLTGTHNVNQDDYHRMSSDQRTTKCFFC